MKQIKVIYLLGSLNRGGTETLLLDTFRNLNEKDFVAECFYRKGGTLEKDFQLSGIPVKKISTGKNPLTYMLRLRNEIKKSAANIVHAQQFIDAFYAYWACMGLKTKIILTFHGYDYDNGWIGKALLKFIIKRTYLNIYVSHSIKDYYTFRYKLDALYQEVVYNGIDFNKFRKLSLSQVTLRDELKLSKDSLLFGTVGNFIDVRDPLTICHFLKLLYENNTDFHFIFVGKKSDTYPELYDDCVNYCRNNGFAEKVSFAGVRQDVPQLLPQLDAFIYATDHDTFGIAVVEAIFAGIPVFVNNHPVMNEITGNGKLAILYPTKNEQGFMNRFNDYLTNREIYKTMAQQSSLLISEKYSIEKHIQSLKKLYSRIIHNS
jgi:L-malate glycosyltransferase